MLQTGTKETQKLSWLGEKYDSLGIVQETEIWPYW